MVRFFGEWKGCINWGFCLGGEEVELLVFKFKGSF